MRPTVASSSDYEFFNNPGFNPRSLGHGGIWGAEDKAAFNSTVQKTKAKMTAYKIGKIVFVILLYFLSNYQEHNSVEGRIQVWNRISNFLISAVLRIRIRDPVLLAPGSGIRDEHPRSFFLELRNSFLG
jgi:hypothetical protein